MEKYCIYLSKLLAVLCGICLISLAINDFVIAQETDNLDLMNGIWHIYWIIFGILIILAECKIGCIAKYFGFLTGYCGLSIFVIFCGTIIIDNWGLETAMGIAMIICGLFFMMLGTKIKKEDSGKAQEPNTI